MSLKIRNDLNEYEWQKFAEELNQETPRAAVIISGAMLDELLRDLLASFMIDDKSKVDELLGSEKNAMAPLSSFGARIQLAYTLGLISKFIYDDLILIKKIRNSFAHKKHGYSFDADKVVSLCNSLKVFEIMTSKSFKITDSVFDKFKISVVFLASRIGLYILETQHQRRNVPKEVIKPPIILRVE